MITVRSFLVCDSAAVDARFQTFSAFHIMEQVQSASFPFLIPRMCIVVTLDRDDANDTASPLISVRATLGEQEVFTSPMQLVFDERNIARTVADIYNLPIIAPGNLRLGLTVEGQELSAWKIQILNVGTPRVETHPVAAPTADPQAAPQPA